MSNQIVVFELLKFNVWEKPGENLLRVEDPLLVSVIVEIFQCFYATESFTLPPWFQIFFFFFEFVSLRLGRCFLLTLVKHIFPSETRIVCGSRPWNSSICSYAVEYPVCTEVLVIQMCSSPISLGDSCASDISLFVSLLPLNHCARGYIMVIYIYVEIYIRNIYIYIWRIYYLIRGLAYGWSAPGVEVCFREL